MQITLNQDEIIDAVKAYVRSQINIAPNQDIMIDLRAGRGENGFTATLDIVPQKKSQLTTRDHVGTSAPTAPATMGISATPEAREPAAPGSAVPRAVSANNPFAKVAAVAAAVVAETPAAEPDAAPEPEAVAVAGAFVPDETLTEEDQPGAGEPEAPAEVPAEEPAPAAETTPAPRSIFSKAKAS